MISKVVASTKRERRTAKRATTHDSSLVLSLSLLIFFAKLSISRTLSDELLPVRVSRERKKWVKTEKVAHGISNKRNVQQLKKEKKKR